MLFTLLLIFVPSFASTQYGSVSSPDPYDFLLNPYVFFPCFKVICSKNVGCFDPFLFNGYIITLPPFSACPEVYRAGSIRFLTISRDQPTVFQSVNIVKQGSRIAILTIGIFQEYDALLYLVLAQTLLRTEYDYVVLVDSEYILDPYLFDHVPGTLLTVSEEQVNSVVVGRVVCNFVHHVSGRYRINPKTIRVVGHSAGANLLAQLGEYCQTRYDLKIGHLVGKYKDFQPS